MTDTYYENIVKKTPALEKLIPEEYYNYMTGSGKHTVSSMQKIWLENLHKNFDKHYSKHGSIYDSFNGFGHNKAIICVGAGPSFNKNKDYLKKIYLHNIQFPLALQPFIIIAPNHQFKPLLNMGIKPHFVILADAGKHVYDQLCKDIPQDLKGTVLFASLSSHPKIIKDWCKQGRLVSFFSGNGEYFLDALSKKTKVNLETLTIPAGGNVANNAFVMCYKFLGAKIFMSVGNDLSYPYSDDVGDRRSSYYADGDYSSQYKDEAKEKFAWMGIEFSDLTYGNGKRICNLKPVLTSRQLFIYKTWIEMNISTWAEHTNDTFQYYNCSEGGICGVMTQNHTVEAMDDISNWSLMDDVCPKRWKTRTLEDATTEFLTARQVWQEQAETRTNAGGIIATV